MSTNSLRKLEQVADINMGQSPPSETYNKEGHGLPFFQGKAEFTSLHPAVEKWCSDPKKIAEKDDILISVRAPVGAVNIAREECCIGRGLAAIRFKGYNKYLFYYLKSARRDLEKQGTGTTFKAISGKILKDFEIPYPPLPTQHRIVEKIEELFSDLDNGVENLKKAKKQLETYKQSVLKAAFEGKLTKQWREQQEDLPTPDELKAQIEEERQCHREQQLEEWRQEVKEWEEAGESGKKPQKPMEGRTFDPLDEELEDLPNLPKEWDWIRISDTVSRVEYGTSQKSEDTGKVPVLRMGNMQDGKFVWDDLVYSNDPKEIDKYLLKPGDVLFNRTNSPELVGKTALYKGKRKAIFAGYLIRLNQIDTIIDARYLTYYLNSCEAQNYGNKVKTDGVNQSNINGTKLSGYPLPYTSLREQKKIADTIDSRLSIVEQTQKTIQHELQKAKALRQSILKRAFEGKLVKEESAIKRFQKPIRKFYDKTATDLHAKIMARIIDAHYESEKHLDKLNHVKCEKVIHMIESHEGVDLQRVPVKDAAGPDDYRCLKKVEHRASLKNWFAIDKSLGGDLGYGYKPKKSIAYAIADIEKIEDLPLRKIDNMIKLFLPMDKERAEVVATLYAAWNNLLIDNHKPSDEEIIQAAREEWSEQKLKIKRQNFVKALSWMRKKELIPAGLGKPVRAKK